MQRLSIFFLLAMLVETVCAGNDPIAIHNSSTINKTPIAINSIDIVSNSQTNEQQIQSQTQQQHSPQQQRRLFDFWSFLFALNAHCPPIGPLHDKCSNSNDSDSSSSSSSSSATYSENVASEGAVEGSESGRNGTGFSRFSIIMLIAAAVAAMFAMMAIVAGVRGQQRPKHPLIGSVARRKTLFQSFTDCALCGDTLHGSNTSPSDAQQRHIEMVDSRDAYDRCNV